MSRKANSRSRIASADTPAGPAGLDLLHGLPERQALELDLQLALGGALAAVQGHGIPTTAHAYERAIDLSRGCGRKDMLFLALTRKDDKVAPQIIANMDLGIVLLSRGELHAATHHLQQAISLHDPAEHEALRLVYSYDPVVICQRYLLALGYPIRRSSAVPPLLPWPIVWLPHGPKYDSDRTFGRLATALSRRADLPWKGVNRQIVTRSRLWSELHDYLS